MVLIVVLTLVGVGALLVIREQAHIIAEYSKQVDKLRTIVDRHNEDWFWEAVDAYGLANVSSDEHTAIVEICARLHDLEKKQYEWTDDMLYAAVVEFYSAGLVQAVSEDRVNYMKSRVMDMIRAGHLIANENDVLYDMENARDKPRTECEDGRLGESLQ